MQLKQLKLVGFKSFVEPTIIPFPSQRVAVVGPNGCGKSNIIDAVRWVMGESSAKNLRGESMADVIFNGSSQRKSIGQASVELIFDNSLGRLGGEYASYQEIAVKRLVTRSGESAYFLNGSRCRRRDINDIFLGTGAGSRGYAIIGQDMISRLIEARPEELRAYLEEAAGVSKYKERRRETLSLISNTRENLERVTDIRNEIDKQLARLERQANAAERYKHLKQNEHLYKVEILALKWQSLTQQQAQVNQGLAELALQYEQAQSKLSAILKEDVSLRQDLQQARDMLQQIQTNYYQLSTEIARLEEGIQQHSREKQRLITDQQQAQTDWQRAVSQAQQDAESLHIGEQQVQTLQDQLHQMRQEFAAQHVLLDEKQQQESLWNKEWLDTQAALHQAHRQVQVEQINLQHMEQNSRQNALNLEKINHERSFIQLTNLQTDLFALEKEQANLSSHCLAAEKNYQQCVVLSIDLRQQLTETEQHLHQAHDHFQTVATQHAALLAAQRGASPGGNESAGLSRWKNSPRLIESITVDEQWFHAVELVLGDSLQAVLLDSVETVWPELSALQGSRAIFVTAALRKNNASPLPSLADKIVGVTPYWLYSLENIFAANDLAQALQWLPLLEDGQSVITATGYWLGHGWVKIAPATQDEAEGLLFRQQALAKLNAELVVADEVLENLKARRKALHDALTENSLKEDALKSQRSMRHEALRAGELTINSKQQAVEHALMRLKALNEESEALNQMIVTSASQFKLTESQYQAALQEYTHYQQQQEQLSAAKSAWENLLNTCREQVNTLSVALHQMELAFDREKLKVLQLQENINREQLRIETLHERLEALASRSIALEGPDAEYKKALAQKIVHYQQIEETLALKRQQLEEVQKKLNNNMDAFKQAEQQAKSVQEQTQQQQLQAQTLLIRTQGVEESLHALDASVETLLASMSQATTIENREQDLIAVEEKIKRLGAINLVAIEEYATECQRKQHLDEQYEDLTEALATLDKAISKMDKETHLRLQETFDQINVSFQALFPRLFGGGRAMLELTCDNLLEAGIIVMAQPPGKRNSTIHLLSGGEKAMTAVALVFAIFQLNPSPFCMLDEVDAPLDDSNAQRFCDLVKEMSQFVQFLFITHNKVTMAMADHLIGVTMREPGVSRIVAVDVEEALALVE